MWLRGAVQAGAGSEYNDNLAEEGTTCGEI